MISASVLLPVPPLSDPKPIRIGQPGKVFMVSSFIGLRSNGGYTICTRVHYTYAHL